MLNKFDKQVLIVILVLLVVFFGFISAAKMILMYIGLILFGIVAILIPMGILIALGEVWENSKQNKMSFTKNVKLYWAELFN